MKGRLQIYTGAGKGKTTAALGLALRASGAGLKIFFAQFIKKGEYCEILALKELAGSVTIRQYGRGCFIRNKPAAADIRAAQRGMSELRGALTGGSYDLVIADELNPAVRCGLVDIKDVVRLADERPENVELVITGRDAHRTLIRKADLVTDMRCVKHYHADGAKARKGIEC